MPEKKSVTVSGVGGDQVFYYETEEELADIFKTTQTNATGKIRELSQALSNQTVQNAQTQPTSQENADAKTQFFNNLYQDPRRAVIGVLEEEMGMPFADFKRDYEQVRAGSQKAIVNEVAATFAQSHPELLQVPHEDDKHNGKVIGDILMEHEWAYNTKNLEAAYALARQQGKLKLLESSPWPEATLTPAPTTVSRPTGAVNTSLSEEAFLNDPNTPTHKIKEYLEKKYANQRP